MASTSYTVPRFDIESNEINSVHRLIQSITINIQKIAQNGRFSN